MASYSTNKTLQSNVPTTGTIENVYIDYGWVTLTKTISELFGGMEFCWSAFDGYWDFVEVVSRWVLIIPRVFRSFAKASGRSPGQTATAVEPGVCMEPLRSYELVS